MKGPLLAHAGNSHFGNKYLPTKRRRSFRFLSPAEARLLGFSECSSRCHSPCSKGVITLGCWALCVPMNTLTVSRDSPSTTEHVSAHPLAEVTHEDVEHVVGRIEHELQVLRTEHAAIAKRIGLIKNTIAGLQEVFGPVGVSPELQRMIPREQLRRQRNRGLTDACREVLRETCEPHTLKQISERIHDLHPTLFARHKYPTAIVQMLLRRLVMYGEAEEVEGNGLRTWKSASSRPT